MWGECLWWGEGEMEVRETKAQSSPKAVLREKVFTCVEPAMLQAE